MNLLLAVFIGIVFIAAGLIILLSQPKPRRPQRISTRKSHWVDGALQEEGLPTFGTAGKPSLTWDRQWIAYMAIAGTSDELWGYGKTRRAALTDLKKQVILYLNSVLA